MKKYRVIYKSTKGRNQTLTFDDAKSAKKEVELGLKFIENFGGKIEYETFNVSEK